MNLENYKWVQSRLHLLNIKPKNHKAIPKPYRLLVKRRLKKDGQINMVTQDAYDYRAILTNNFDMTDLEVANFYAKRGGNIGKTVRHLEK